MSEEFCFKSNFSTKQNDIWAVGIILINLIASANPWTIASDEDRSFSAFLHNSNYLRTRLPISTQANDLIVRILHPDPYKRLSLPKIRAEMAKIKNFFMTPEEIAVSTPHVRMWHEKLTTKRSAEPSHAAAKINTLDSPAGSHIKPSSSDSSFESVPTGYGLDGTSLQSQTTKGTSVHSREGYEAIGSMQNLACVEKDAPKVKVDLKLQMLMRDIMDGLEDYERESV